MYCCSSSGAFAMAASKIAATFARTFSPPSTGAVAVAVVVSVVATAVSASAVAIFLPSGGRNPESQKSLIWINCADFFVFLFFPVQIVPVVYLVVGWYLML